MSKKKCSVEGCEKTVVVEGLCNRHYHEKHGHTYKPEKHYKKGKEKTRGIQNKPLRHEQPGQRPEPTPNPQKKRVQRLQFAGDLAHAAADHAAAQVGAIFPGEGPLPNSVIQIDFTGHDELFRMICAEAKKEFRPVEFQILYLLDAFREVKNGSIPDPAAR